MRIAIIGTGGVGGFVGAKLFASGHDVHFLARGSHLAAMQRSGLLVHSPDGKMHVPTDRIHSHLSSVENADDHLKHLRLRGGA